MEVLFSISIALVAGLFVSRLTKPLKLPAVTGYLIAGVLIGPYCLGSFGLTGLFSSHEGISSLGIIADVALGFIAFDIGTEFRLENLKKTGKQTAIIGVMQAVVTCLLVDGALIGLHFLMPEKLPLSVAITLGAIATATAPAATLMVVRQYKARGKLTDILLPVVALDDAVGLICFAVSFGIAKALQSGSISLISVLVEPILEVVLSLALGAVIGIVFSFVENLFKSNSKRLCLSITFVLMTVSISMLKFEVGGVHIGFSSLLVCMMLGTMFCNVCDCAMEMMEKTSKWTMPIYILFFVLSGAELEFNIFADSAVIIIGLVYLVFRTAGKYFGAYISAKGTHCDPTIVKYLGVALWPQAGVAIGMTVTALALGAVEGALIRNIVLFAVLVYEIFGPMCTKLALQAAGNIVPKQETVKHHVTLAEAFADEPDEEDIQ